MMAPSKTALAGVLAVLAAAPLVSAHGYMSVPKTTFAVSDDPTQFAATIDGPSTLTAPSGMSFTTDPASNTKAFTAALKASTYKSMRALVDAKGVFIKEANKECGVTSPTGAKQPLPDKYVEWSHSSSEGFTPSHQGPCEIWCDDKMAFQDDNCAADYTTAPALLPYDKSKCTGASMLKIYWLALHSSTWQAYINCAPLEGGSGSSGSTTPSVTPASSGATTKTPAPAASKTPAPTASAAGDEDCDDDLDIKGSSSVGADEDCDDDLDIADTKAPAASSTPASSPITSPATTPSPVSGSASTSAPSSGYDEYATPTPSSTSEVGGDADTASEDCDDDLDIKGSSSAGADEDCDDDLDIADTKAPAASSTPASSPTTSPATTPSPVSGSASTSAPSSGYDEYATPTPSSTSEVGGDADTASEDCDDDLDIKGSSSVGADEDCDDGLDIAGSDEDCELDVASSSSVRTSDLDFSSLTTADKAEIGTVDAY